MRKERRIFLASFCISILLHTALLSYIFLGSGGEKEKKVVWVSFVESPQKNFGISESGNRSQNNKIPEKLQNEKSIEKSIGESVSENEKLRAEIQGQEERKENKKKKDEVENRRKKEEKLSTLHAERNSGERENEEREKERRKSEKIEGRYIMDGNRFPEKRIHENQKIAKSPGDKISEMRRNSDKERSENKKGVEELKGQGERKGNPNMTARSIGISVDRAKVEERLAALMKEFGIKGEIGYERGKRYGEGEDSGGVSDEEIKTIYARLVKSKVEDEFEIPPSLKDKELVCTVFMKIGSNGELLELKIESSSGDPNFDVFVLRSIKKASPFPPPPSYPIEFIVRFSNMR